PGPLGLSELEQLVKRHKVSTLWLTSGLFQQVVLHRLEMLRGVRQLLAGGDVLPAPQVKTVLERFHLTLVNGYGPTEGTTFSCCHVMTSPDQLGEKVPIGRPIANTQAFILDRYLSLLPIGVPGELYLGGDGLAQGYLG